LIRRIFAMTPSSPSRLKQLAVAALLVAASTLSQAATRQHHGHVAASHSSVGHKTAHGKRVSDAHKGASHQAHAARVSHLKQGAKVHASAPHHPAALHHHRTAGAKASARHATAKTKVSGQRHALSRARHPAASKAAAHRAH
jgi:hypothetical protein